MKRIAIVGGGWAGLAAAVKLAEAGVGVSLFESAKQLGGRARRVDWHGLAVDNGQHLMIGAYRETLALMNIVGTADLVARRRLELSLPDFRMRLPHLPAPLNLALGQLMAQGLGLLDKISAARFVQTLKQTAFMLPVDCPASALLARHGQSPELVTKLWEPICVASLNTPLQMASAQVFCNVLRDSLTRARADSDLVFQRAHMGRLLPEAAHDWLTRQGCQVRLSTRIKAIDKSKAGFQLDGDPEAGSYDSVILAVHPAHLPDLLPARPELSTLGEQARSLTWQPILTTWMHFAAPLPFPFPMLGLAPGAGPWLFDRGDVAAGVAAVVVSAEGPHLELAPEALRDQFLNLIGMSLGPVPELLDWKTIIEKRATFACVPGMVRPGNRTALHGLYIAGDYTGGDFPTDHYPATLEGAVRSGVKSARLILDNP